MTGTDLVVIDGRYAEEVRTLSQRLLDEDRETLIEVRIVLAITREDHDERWQVAELERQMPEIPPLDVADALERLGVAELLTREGEVVIGTRALLYLGALGVVAL